MAEHQQHKTEKILDKEVVKVGVIFVHGIGETGRFEHLEDETRKIVDAIIANYGARRRDVTPTLKRGSGDAYQGDQASWVSGAEAPLHVFVELHEKIVDIAFHEVWWADINEVLTLGKQVRFWAWGLSLAGIATHNEKFLPGTDDRMRLPDNYGKLTWWNRIRMGYVSTLFGFSAFSIALVNFLLKRLDFAPLLTTGIIVNYLSSVKLYSQDKRAGGSPMDGPDEPPRAAIRRRMIRVMVDVARAEYERWYILAHSQGSVVAWNGLMEIQQALPNYLDKECWETLAGSPLRGTSDFDFDRDAMMPNRPVWVGPRDIIKRDVLFEKFRGILTYGSPLERFCALWSAMVPINLKENVFQEGTEWINVYDPTDPVGTWISDFDPKETPQDDHTVLKPQNFPCRASPILLLSHICYLTASRWRSFRLANGKKHLLVNQIGEWLIHDRSLAEQIKDAPKRLLSFWMPRTESKWGTHLRTLPRVAWRFVQWIIVGVVLTALTLLSLRYIIWPVVSVIPHIPGLVLRLLDQFARFNTCLWSNLAGWLPSLNDIIEWPVTSSQSRIWPHILGIPGSGRLAFVADLVREQAVILWETTIVGVALASIIQYIWSTIVRRNLGKRLRAQRTKLPREDVVKMPSA